MHMYIHTYTHTHIPHIDFYYFIFLSFFASLKIEPRAIALNYISNPF